MPSACAFQLETTNAWAFDMTFSHLTPQYSTN